MIFDIFATKVAEKLPFEPNEQQKNCLDLLSRFLFDTDMRDRVFILRGYAGTGKTSIVGALVQAMADNQMKTCLMAPTGRAAKVFAAMAHKSALTIHKSIYRQKTFNVDLEGFQLMDNMHKDTLFICDEASMISSASEGSSFGTGCLLDDLVEYVYAGVNCRLLLVGDGAQLPPVGQAFSAALNADWMKNYGMDIWNVELTQVARQGLHSGILYNATALRDRMRQNLVEDLPKIRCADFKDVKRIDGLELLECLSSSYSRSGIDETIIITRSNARANRFNMGVRNQILYREEELSPGDRLLVVKNNYYWSKDFDNMPFIANGDILEVKRVRNVRNMYGFRFADVQVYFPDYEVDTEVVMLLDTLQAEGPSLPVADVQRLFWAVMEDYMDIPGQRERIKAVKENRYFNALQVKYGYAVTCHKAQGGQWNDVYLDLGYINVEHLGLDFYRWMYTAFTRAKQRLFLVNMCDDMSE